MSDNLFWGSEKIISEAKRSQKNELSDVNKTYNIDISNGQKFKLLISKSFEKSYVTVAEFYLEQVFLVAN